MSSLPLLWLYCCCIFSDASVWSLLETRYREPWSTDLIGSGNCLFSRTISILHSRIALGNWGVTWAFILPSISRILLTSAGAEFAAQLCSTGLSLRKPIACKGVATLQNIFVSEQYLPSKWPERMKKRKNSEDL